MQYELLLVDDERVPRESLAAYFPWEKYGFHICGQAADGKEALGILSRQTVHVVLSDIQMPVMDGLELAREIYAQGKQQVVILLTAYGEFEYAQKAIEYGVRNYLVKPSGFKEIGSVFSKVKEELDVRYGVLASRPEATSDSDIIAIVYDYLHREYQTASLGKLAQRLYLSEPYLSQLIIQKTGSHFSALLQVVRMEEACRLLLDENEKIYNIGLMVGYNSPGNFTRAFKNCYGMSPSEFRERRGIRP